MDFCTSRKAAPGSSCAFSLRTFVQLISITSPSVQASGEDLTQSHVWQEFLQAIEQLDFVTRRKLRCFHSFGVQLSASHVSMGSIQSKYGLACHRQHTQAEECLLGLLGWGWSSSRWSYRDLLASLLVCNWSKDNV